MNPYECFSKPLLSNLGRLPSRPTARRRPVIARHLSAGLVDDKATASTESPEASSHQDPSPEHGSSPQQENAMSKDGDSLVGSRRRRMALQSTPGIPFEKLPYQCFQEARKVLIADREEKLKQIQISRDRIARLRGIEPVGPNEEARKQQRIKDVTGNLERLKIMGDINDPLVKRRFEDGLGDMNKPIYRYLADRKWRQYRRLVVMQRITQMKVTPDVLPKIEPSVDVKLAFVPPTAYSRRGLDVGDTSKGMRSGDFKYIQPGEFVTSKMSENPCWLNVQSFERGERLVSIAVVDSDVPDLENDRFTYRCHFLASNVTITPTQRIINLSALSKIEQVLLPWMPPFAQKGSPYHRLSVFVLQQEDNAPIDLELARERVERDGFELRSFRDRHLLTPIGVHLFRTIWDEGMAEVMQRAGIEGADLELKRIKVEPLPYKRRNPSSFR